MFKKNMFSAVLFLFLGILVAGCSLSDDSTEKNTRDFRSGDFAFSTDANDGSFHVPIEDQKEFIEKFLAHYDLKFGTYFIVEHGVILNLREGSEFEALNLGTGDNPQLSFELRIPKAVQDNEVVSLKNDSTIAHTFIITSKSTANFNMNILTKGGIEYQKNMEIEIKEENDEKFLYLDKVLIAQEIPKAPNVTMESFNAIGFVNGTSAEFREGQSLEVFTKTYSFKSYMRDVEALFVEKTPLWYQIIDGNLGKPQYYNIYLKSPLDHTRRIYHRNIERLQYLFHTGVAQDLVQFHDVTYRPFTMETFSAEMWNFHNQQEIITLKNLGMDDGLEFTVQNGSTIHNEKFDWNKNGGTIDKVSESRYRISFVDGRDHVTITIVVNSPVGRDKVITRDNVFSIVLARLNHGVSTSYEMTKMSEL